MRTDVSESDQYHNIKSAQATGLPYMRIVHKGEMLNACKHIHSYLRYLCVYYGATSMVARRLLNGSQQFMGLTLALPDCFS